MVIGREERKFGERDCHVNDSTHWWMIKEKVI